VLNDGDYRRVAIIWTTLNRSERGVLRAGESTVRGDSTPPIFWTAAKSMQT